MAVTIESYIKDEKILEYVKSIIDIFEIIQKDFNTIARGYKIEFLIFGGFVRDIVKGISYENLKKRDIDLYVRYNFINKNLHYLNSIYVRSMFDSIKNISKKYYDVEFISNNYNKINDYHTFEGYDVLKLKINNICIDIACDINNNNRFETIIDFTCNALYFSIDDKVMHARTSYCTIQKCIDDVQEQKLVSFFENDILHNQNIKKRIEKMIAYGYKFPLITPLPLE